MIYFILTPEHAYTIQGYLASWAPMLKPVVKVCSINTMMRYRNFAPGAYIFSDLDRYDEDQRAWAIQAAATVKADPASLVLNDPAACLGRLALLQSLHASGHNQFNAHAYPWPAAHPPRLPALVRRESGHDGPVGELLWSIEALDQAGRALQTEVGDDVIAVEFQDTVCPDGFYRKYSCFRVGNSIVPRHLLVSPTWMLKTPDLVTNETAREEDLYLVTNPHRKQVMDIFRRARIDYGRIDYSLDPVTGAIQTWEINTNPFISKAPGLVAPIRRAGHAYALEKLRQAFGRLVVTQRTAAAKAAAPGSAS